MAQHPDLIDGRAHFRNGSGDLVQNFLALVQKGIFIGTEKHGVIKGDEHIAVSLPNAHLFHHIFLLKIFCHGLVKLFHIPVHLILCHDAALGRLLHARPVDHCTGIECLDQGDPFGFIHFGHGEQHYKKAEQKRDHVAIGVHPVCAAAL